MSFLSIPPLISSILFIALGTIIYAKGKKTIQSIAFCFTCFATFWWQFSWFILFNVHDSTLVPVLVKFGYIGIILIPVTYFHFFVYFLGARKFDRKLVLISYFVAALFELFLLFSNYLIDGYYDFSWGYYPKASFLHPLYLLFLFILAARAIFLLRRALHKNKKNIFAYNKIKYVLVSLLFYMPSASDFITNYGVNFYPVGFIFILIALSIMGYAIQRYRLMDVRMAITKASIFVVVYTLVLGIPFGLGLYLFGIGLWLIPIILMAVFATAGPFIYLYVQKRAEGRLLYEQHQYQNTLRRASIGMGRIKDLKRLLDLIVHIVTRTVRLNYCAVYLLHEASQQYTLKATKGWKAKEQEDTVMSVENPLIGYLKKAKEPIVQEELSQRAHDYHDGWIKRVVEEMQKLDAALAIPSFIEDRLIAVIFLGKKRDGKLYTHDDLVVFSILSNQAALAIENAQFVEDTKKTHEQLFKAEKMATIGTMADGLSHQINNRLHAMGFIAGDALDTVKLEKAHKLPKSQSEKLLDTIEHALERLVENVKRGGEIVEGLLRYTRKGEEGFSDIDINELLSASLEMVQYKVKIKELDIKRNMPDDISKVQGNFTQLQEVFFNLIDNAYDAIIQRKAELKEHGFKGAIEFIANKKGKVVEIVVKDNGIGVAKDDANKLFTPFFTTKLSSKKGTGLGLYVIRQIIEENHGGRVIFNSEYKQGSEINITLPVAKDGKQAIDHRP